MLTTPVLLGAHELAAVADLERRVVAHDGGRLKLEWGVLRSPSGTGLLHWHGEVLVGFLGVYAFGPPDVELAGMVDPATRRRGIGSGLLAAAVPHCRERGFARALLVTPAATPAGRSFAVRQGARRDHNEHALALADTPAGPVEDPAVALRPATVAELPEVRRLLTAGFGRDPGELSGRLEAADTTMLVTRHGHAVGTLRLSRHDGLGGIYGFVIDPGLQGRGIGRDVLARACRLLRAEGSAGVTLEVATDNDRALALYTSTGFVPETTEDYWAIDL